MRSTPLLSLLVLLGACGTQSPSSPSATDAMVEPAAMLLPASEYELVADGVHQGPAVAVAEVLATPEAYEGRGTLRVEGDIVAVCPKRGCWMRLGDDERNLFVKFAAGCSEFVPLDAAGRLARVEGELVVEEVSVEEVKHLLEDEGKHEEAARVTEPQVRPRFVATGAALRVEPR